MPSDDRVRLEASLRRIEELVSALDRLSDPNTREHARELLETVLDLHGLAIARMVAFLAQTERGTDLLEQLGRDEQVRAVLLLHGLHPQELETRIRRALEDLQPSMRSRAVHVELMGVSGGAVRLRVRRSDAGGVAAEIVRQEIEEALLEAAPDLDAIDIQLEERHEERPAEVAASVG